MFKPIDSLIDKVTMYRLLLYYLIALVLIAITLSIFGYLHYNPLYIFASATILVTACWSINKIFAYIFLAPTNTESSIITGLILALIIPPNPTGFGFTFLVAAAGLAMASKYIFTINKKHIFNPAAIAVVLLAFGPRQSANWWVGTATMLPFVIIGGVLIARKVRRLRMVSCFYAVALITTGFYAWLDNSNVWFGLHHMVFGTALFFMGYVMLTEPMTSPLTAPRQTWYATIVGFLLPPQVHILKLYSSPELALVVGNAFSYIVSPKTKLFPNLIQKIRTANSSSDFVFSKNRDFSYRPGQYIELTLPHREVDSRGNRRYFTLASSPTEPNLRIGVKFYNPGSSFKKALLAMNNQTPVAAGQLAGNFTLPKNKKRKIVFIAGGIGITPYRSMIKYLLDTNDRRDITLLYSERNAQELVYGDVFSTARQELGLKTVYTLTDPGVAPPDWLGQTGYITAQMIIAQVPDYKERLFYISGSHSMVTAMKETLRTLGVHHRQIKTDFFPGYA